VPDRRYVVADGNRVDHDFPAARRDPDQVRQRHPALPGVIAEVVDNQGKTGPGQRGRLLVIRKPWPSILRTSGATTPVQGQYWTRVPGIISPPTGSEWTRTAYLWIMAASDERA